MSYSVTARLSLMTLLCFISSMLLPSPSAARVQAPTLARPASAPATTVVAPPLQAALPPTDFRPVLVNERHAPPSAAVLGPKQPLKHARLEASALTFVPNRGQTDGTALFETRALGGSMFFTRTGVVLALPTTPSKHEQRMRGERAKAPPSQRAVVRVQYQQTNASVKVQGSTQVAGVVNDLRAPNPTTWRKSIPTYAGVLYQQLYAGIDLQYDGPQGQLKGTYRVAPGADATLIQWRYEGVTNLHIDSRGHLIMTPAGTPADAGLQLTEAAPTAWQDIKGTRVPVTVRYQVAANGTVSFAVGTYDAAYPLTIDPTLTYTSSTFGGFNTDEGNDIAVDPSGNVYVTGTTGSSNFPGTTPSQFYGGLDIFVRKYTAAGALQWTTIVGGNGQDRARGITVDQRSGNLLITGDTASTQFLGGSGVHGGTGDYDAFVVLVQATDGVPIANLVLGGMDSEYGGGVATDSTLR